MREKNCQYLNFGKIFYLSTFCAQTCLQEASKKCTRVGFEIRTKSWPKSQKIQIFTVLTPPTLAKSATKLDSIKKLTKGLFLISPIPGRMQKFREIVCADREKGIRIFSGFIYVTTTRTGQGPYPALNDNECTNSDHLGGRRGQEQVLVLIQEFAFYFHSVVLFFIILCLIVICQCPSVTGYVSDTFICIQFSFFPFVPSNKGTGTVNLSNFSFSVWAFCGVRPHKKCSQKFWKFWKKFYVQILKILISNFGSKKHSNRRILVSEVQKNNFCDQKKFLKFFDFWT